MFSRMMIKDVKLMNGFPLKNVFAFSAVYRAELSLFAFGGGNSVKYFAIYRGSKIIFLSFMK